MALPKAESRDRCHLDQETEAKYVNAVPAAFRLDRRCSLGLVHCTRTWDNIVIQMSTENPSNVQPSVADSLTAESPESFGDALREFEASHRAASPENRQV